MPHLSSHGGIVDDRVLVTPAFINMQVEGVVAGVYFRTGIPAVIGFVGIVENLVPRFFPMDQFCRLSPVFVAVRDGKIKFLFVFAHDLMSSYLELKLTFYRVCLESKNYPVIPVVKSSIKYLSVKLLSNQMNCT